MIEEVEEDSKRRQTIPIPEEDEGKKKIEEESFSKNFKINIKDENGIKVGEENEKKKKKKEDCC